MVGTMIAIEVPRQSCMRTSSRHAEDAEALRYSTGTKTEPPPTPNRPARRPVTTPPTGDASQNSCRTSQKHFVEAYPDRAFALMRSRSTRVCRLRSVRRWTVAHQRKRLGSKKHPAPAPDVAALGEMPANARAPGTARNRPCRCRVMACSRVALRKFAFDVRHQRCRRLLRRRKTAASSPNTIGIDREQPPRLLIGRASHHHAIDMREMRARLLDACRCRR